jgi:hypothetical protein
VSGPTFGGSPCGLQVWLVKDPHDMMQVAVPRESKVYGNEVGIVRPIVSDVTIGTKRLLS